MMSRPKEIKWYCRSEDIPEENVYMFRKSLETLKKTKLFRHELLIEKARCMFSEGGIVPTSRFNDPVLSYLFGLTSVPPSTETIIEYYMKDAQHFLSGTSFVDMCFVFNEANVAHDFAKLHNIDFDILHFHEIVVKNASLPMSDIYEMETTINWLKVMERNDSQIPLEKKRTSAERLGFVMRFLSGQKITTISEMAARGYYWDAFILMSILYPDHDLTMQFRVMVWQIYELDCFSDVISIKTTADMGALLKVRMSQLSIYNAITDSLKCNIGNPFVMSKTFRNMRVCLLAMVCTDAYNTAMVAAENLFKLVTSDSTLRAEFLPAAETELFEVAFVTISNLVGAVIHTSKSIENNTLDGSNGLIKQLFDNLQRYKDMFSNTEARMGISSILYKFTCDVKNCSDMCYGKPLYKEFIILALGIGEMILKEEHNSQNAKAIRCLVIDSNISKQIIQSMLLELKSLPDDLLLMDILVVPMRKLLLDVCDLLGLVMNPVAYSVPACIDDCGVQQGPFNVINAQSNSSCLKNTVISKENGEDINKFGPGGNNVLEENKDSLRLV